MIIRKNAAELERMRRSGLLVWKILQDLSKLVQEGVTTQDLEVAAEKMMQDAGAKPAFKGYYTQAAGTKYPFVLCTSVNDEIVHGMPSAKRKLKKGDIVSIDTGVQLKGYFGDSAVTVPVGEVSERTKKLLQVTRGVVGTGHRRRRGQATACSIFAERCRSTWRATDFRLCVKWWGMGSGRSCTKSRRFPITWTGATRIRVCEKEWCWRSSRW